MKKTVIALFLAICIGCAALFGACGSSKEVKSIEVTKLPKTEYSVGETLDLSGGEITATYTDGSTTVIQLTDPAVTIARPNMGTTGSKTVSVTYKSASATFKVTVSLAKLAVTFDMNYDGGQDSVVRVEPNTPVAAITEPTRAGYAFLGWYVGEGESAAYNFDVAVTEDITVYAHWGYAVTFDLDQTGVDNKVVKTEAGGVVARPESPTRTGYMFTGWYTAKGGSTEYDFSKPLTGNVTLYAGWQEITADTKICKVTFDYNDNYRSEEKLVVSGGKVSAIATTPKITGATFAGWYADKACTTPFDFAATAVTADTTVYAKWNVEKYTAYFHFNHELNGAIREVTGIRSTLGTIIDPDTATETDLEGYQAVKSPTINGYYFAGWYSDPELTEKAVFPINRVSTFHHFYAKWQKEWEFQAEYTDFGERTAFGYSANGQGASAFINKNLAELWGAHDGFWVANLHNQGLYVEFIINSDRAVDDATLVLRLSADFYDIVLSKTNFEIKVNDKVIDYDFVANITGAIAPTEGGVQNKRPFDNWKFLDNLSLVKGENKIRFTMLDSQKYGEVGTMNATAPMFDSIYVNCNAELSWDPLYSNVG